MRPVRVACRFCEAEGPPDDFWCLIERGADSRVYECRVRVSKDCRAIQLLVQKGLSVTAARVAHLAPRVPKASVFAPLEIETRPAEVVDDWKGDGSNAAAGPGLLQTIGNFFMGRAGYKLIKQD